MQIALAYLDDRKTKELRDEREKVAREARAVAQANRAAQGVEVLPELDVPGAVPRMPGTGHRLNNEGAALTPDELVADTDAEATSDNER